jgi:hypothetical protein
VRDAMTAKQLRLRRPGLCCACREELCVGAEAIWNAAARTLTCLNCVEGSVRAHVVTPVDGPADVGIPGRSARAQGNTKRAAERARRVVVKHRHPVLGRIALALEGPATSADSWLVGAKAEEMFGTRLNDMVEAGLLSLHDRRIPGSPANVDHIVVSSNAVWVIDTKRYSGKIDVVDAGGWFRSDFRLVVAGRDRTKLVSGVRGQVAHVARMLRSTEHRDVPVRGALCFVDAEFPFFYKPTTVDDVLIGWGRALREIMAQPGCIAESERAGIHRFLGARFAPR